MEKHCNTCARKDSGFNCLYACHGKELSAYLPFSEAKKTVTLEVPFLATNGDMLKALFPDGIKEEYCCDRGNYIIAWIDEVNRVQYELSWWNALYERKN